MILTYTELVEIPTFEERLAYLQLDARPGDQTFGALRAVNQRFYNSPLWKQVRSAVIARDLGYDLAVPGRNIFGKVLVHHINPLIPKDIYHERASVVDLENLITVSFETHQCIHFGATPTFDIPMERVPGDTQLWRTHGHHTW